VEVRSAGCGARAIVDCQESLEGVLFASPRQRKEFCLCAPGIGKSIKREISVTNTSDLKGPRVVAVLADRVGDE
jgi:hypothetical protein